MFVHGNNLEQKEKITAKMKEGKEKLLRLQYLAEIRIKYDRWKSDNVVLFGPTSIEVEDTYVRLDRDLAAFFAFLDENIGKGKYLTFLTADHGAVHIAQYLKDNKIPAGRFSEEETKKKLNIYTFNKYQDSLIAFVCNQQVYFDLDKLAQKKISKKEISNEIADYILGFEGVANSFTSETFESDVKKRIVNDAKFRNDFNFAYVGVTSMLVTSL